ncbi:MAG: universal stress protein, partial [Beijerinckiaceae bacterium]
MRHDAKTPTHTRPKMDPPDAPVRRVMVGTDRSETADQAVRWAASLAERCGAELIVVQIIVSQ